MVCLVPVACANIGGMSVIQGLDWRGVCNSGVWSRGVSAIQGSGLEGCLQFRVWIRGVSAIQGLD